MGLPYVGPAPTDPNDLVHKGYVDGAISTNKNTYTATSTTSNAVGTGSKTFALTGVGGTPNYVVGQLLRAYNTGTPANYVQGLVTAASSSSVTINATESGGSGTLTAWTISIAGTTGTAGTAGPANTLSIGTVTTGAAGSSASATVGGTSPNQTLSLTIPQGAAGAKGDTGNTGPANTLSIGTVTTGAAGSSASATITGTAPNQTLNLTIPQGTNGTNGSNGSAGATYTTTSTSVTSQAVGTGSKTFTIVGVNGTPNYAVNQLVRVYSTSTPQNYMQGLITATGTGTITVAVTEIGGSGTIASWTIVPSGSPGTVIYVLAPGDADPTAASPAGFYFRRTS